MLPDDPTPDARSTTMTDEPLVGEILAPRATPTAPPAVGSYSHDGPTFGAGDVDELVRRWLVEYRSRHTRDAYLAASDLDPLGPLTRTHVAAWLAAQAEYGRLKPATRARRLAAVSGFYDWLFADGYIARNPTAGLDRAHRPQWPKTSTGPTLTREQAGRLLAAADAYTGASRERAAVVVSLLLYSGIRVSELTDAGVDQLGHSRGHRVLRVHGKGDTEREVVLPPPATRRLDPYLAGRPDLAVARIPALPGQPRTGQHPLVATATGRRMDRGAVWRLLRSLARRAGIPVTLSPHVLRATYVTLARDAGVSLEDIQEAVGHASIATTRRYDRAARRLDRSPGYSLAAYIPVTHENDSTLADRNP
jgi:integrase/recombinase XerD